MSIAFLKNCLYNGLGKLNIIGYWTLRWMIVIFKWSDSKSTKRKSAFVAKVARYIFCIVACKFQGCGKLEFHAVYYILLLTLNNTCYIPCIVLFSEIHPKIYKPFFALYHIIEVYIYIYIYIHMSLTALYFEFTQAIHIAEKRKDITSINNTSLT